MVDQHLNSRLKISVMPLQFQYYFTLETVAFLIRVKINSPDSKSVASADAIKLFIIFEEVSLF